MAGNDSTRGEEPRQMFGRALGYLPAGHGPVAARIDSGFYRIDLLADCRARGVRFSISVPRSSAMWSALERIGEDAWTPADGRKDAAVAETIYAPRAGSTSRCGSSSAAAHHADALSDDPRARRKRPIPRAQLDLGLAGEADVVYGYSFILTDLRGSAATVEHHHRDRAQIEERIKESSASASASGARTWPGGGAARAITESRLRRSFRACRSTPLHRVRLRVTKPNDA